jgi:hypothetical protein
MEDPGEQSSVSVQDSDVEGEAGGASSEPARKRSRVAEAAEEARKQQAQLKQRVQGLAGAKLSKPRGKNAPVWTVGDCTIRRATRTESCATCAWRLAALRRAR